MVRLEKNGYACCSASGPANLNGNKVPVRYIYPVSEQVLNAANRAEAVRRQGNTDDLNTKMWLLTE